MAPAARRHHRVRQQHRRGRLPRLGRCTSHPQTLNRSMPWIGAASAVTRHDERCPVSAPAESTVISARMADLLQVQPPMPRSTTSAARACGDADPESARPGQPGGAIGPDGPHMAGGVRRGERGEDDAMGGDDWHCEAYGPDAPSNARCVVAGEVGRRVCPDPDGSECTGESTSRRPAATRP